MDVAREQQLAIDARDGAALRFGIDAVGIGRIRHPPEAVAAVEVLPARVGDASSVCGVAHPRAVVLKAAVHLVGVLVVDGLQDNSSWVGASAYGGGITNSLLS